MIDTYRLPAVASVPYVRYRTPLERRMGGAVTPSEPPRAERRRGGMDGEQVAGLLLSLAFFFFILLLGVKFIKFLWFF